MRILLEEELVKPRKPEEINEDAELEKLKIKYAQDRKAPGDPILFFELIEENNAISPTDKCAE